MNDESKIVDSNGIPATGERPDLIVAGPIAEFVPDQPDNVVKMPDQQLERRAKIMAKDDRRAIVVHFETLLDGARVNLLLAKIYAGMEKAEREVMALGDKDVERIVARIADAGRV